jgi:hypothetical protein
MQSPTSSEDQPTPDAAVVSGGDRAAVDRSGVILAGERRERAAMAVHEYYLDAMAALREGAGKVAPAGRAWGALSEEFREQNRSYVDSLPAALAAIGLELCELPDADVDGFTDDEVLVLAAFEHHRWCALKRAQNYRGPNDGPEAKGKLHPDLVPFEELDEDQRGFPVAQARRCPAFLAAVDVGFRALR